MQESGKGWCRRAVSWWLRARARAPSRSAMLAPMRSA